MTNEKFMNAIVEAQILAEAGNVLLSKLRFEEADFLNFMCDAQVVDPTLNTYPVVIKWYQKLDADGHRRLEFKQRAMQAYFSRVEAWLDKKNGDFNGPRVAMFALFFFVSGANADEAVKSEWRFLGPAFSHHFSQDGAPKSGTQNVTVNDGANAISVSGCDPSGMTCSRFSGTAHDYCASPANSGSQAAHDACVAQYYKPHSVAQDVHHYHEQNWGIGFEYNERTPDHVTRYFAQAIIDSYNRPGAFFGIARQLTIYSGDAFKIDAGMMAMAWWRTIPTFDGEGGSRRSWVIAPLPVVSIEHQSGIALNASFAPAVRMHGRLLNVNTLMLEFSYRL